VGHYSLDVSPEGVATAARGLAELAEQLTTRSTQIKSTPGEIPRSAWQGTARDAVTAEMTGLGDQTTRFAPLFTEASAALTTLADTARTAKEVTVPSLNSRWDGTNATYSDAVGKAGTAYQQQVSDVDPAVTGPARSTALQGLHQQRQGAVDAAAAARGRAQAGLDAEFAELVADLETAFRTAGGTLAGATVVAVDDRTVADFVAHGGNGTTLSWTSPDGSPFPPVFGAAETMDGMTLAQILLVPAKGPMSPSEDLKALLDRARALGLPPAQYAPLLKEYYLAKAFEKAGIDPATWDPSRGAEYNRDIIEKVYTYYGKLYLDNPYMMWAGMANLIGPSFAAGFFDLSMIRDWARTAAEGLDKIPDYVKRILPPGIDGLEELANATDEDLRFFEVQFLSMQKEIFFDQAVMHEAYLEGGMDAMRELRAAGVSVDDDETLAAWQMIDDGRRTGNQNLIAAGNKGLLWREQAKIIQDDYSAMYNHEPTGKAFTYLMTFVGTPSIPGARGYPDVMPLTVTAETPGPDKVPLVGWDNPLQGTVTVETPLPDGNIANRDDRWALIELDTLPAYQKLLAEDAERARELIGSSVHDRIGDQRIYHQVDDIVGQMFDWNVDFDQ
jgi:uncharacterized protein YukE